MSHGVVLGKFMPPHEGHRYLVDFARHYCDHLTVLVGTLKREPIPGELRVEWMRELFPSVTIVHVTDENPQLPHEHPDFWEIWKGTFERALEQPADFLFASEDYGQKLAQTIGATFVPTNGLRELLPVTGTAIRKAPLHHWDALPVCVRPYFLKRVCVFGPESTGKSTLTAQLAEAFQTVLVPEYARLYLERKDGSFVFDDVLPIARGQRASEKALERQAYRVLFCDTDLLTTSIWSSWMFDRVPEQLTRWLGERTYDLYLVTDVDLPWQADPIRYLPDNRRDFLERCLVELQAGGHPYVLISGEGPARLENALRALRDLLGLERG